MKEIKLLRRKRRSWWRDTVVALVMCGAAFMLTVTLLDTFHTQAEAEAIPIEHTKGTAQELTIASDSIFPNRLQIPRISIDAKVVPVGITHDGAMMSPESFKDVGWYKYGVKPGENGNAYIVGHLDNAFGLSGVFKDLTSVVAGEDIYITDQSGKKLHFKVSKRSIVPYTEESVSEIAQETHLPRIVIITCHGSWLTEEKTYTERLVVVADLQ